MKRYFSSCFVQPLSPTQPARPRSSIARYAAFIYWLVHASSRLMANGSGSKAAQRGYGRDLSSVQVGRVHMPVSLEWGMHRHNENVQTYLPRGKRPVWNTCTGCSPAPALLGMPAG